MPGQLAFHALQKAMWGNIKLRQRAGLAATVGVSVVAYIVLPDIWWAIGAVVGTFILAAYELTTSLPLHLQQMGMWHAREVRQHWLQGVGLASPRSRAEYELFLSSPKAVAIPAARMSDALRNAGELDKAAHVLDASEPENPNEAADLACSRFDLDFLTRGDGDWVGWQRCIDALAPTDVEGKLQRVSMAAYRAAYQAARQGDWRAELEREFALDRPFVVFPPIVARVVVQDAASVIFAVALVGVCALVLHGFAANLALQH